MHTNRWRLAVQVQNVALEANVKKLKIYLRQQLEHEQASKKVKQEKHDLLSAELAERQTRISIFGLTQHICEHYTALLEPDLLTLLSDTLTWAGFVDAAKSLRAEWRSTLAVQDKDNKGQAAVKPLAGDIREVRQMLAAMDARQPTPSVNFQLDHMGHLLSRKVSPYPPSLFSPQKCKQFAANC